MIHLLLLLFLLPQDEVKIEELEPLDDLNSSVPAVFSADGKSLVYVRRTADRKFAYMRADADGKNAREVFETPVNWDDLLCAMIGNASISRNGKEIAVITTEKGQPYRDGKDLLRAAVVAEDGKVRKFGCDVEEVSGLAFSSEGLLTIETYAIRKRQTGYKLRLWQGDKSKVLDDGDDSIGLMLRASPDGNRVAFFLLVPGDRKARIRVYDLKTGKVHETGKFRSDDVTLDGPPQFYWDGNGTGLFYHECTEESGKRPYALMYHDLKNEETRRVLPDDNVGLYAVLDGDHLVVRLEKEDRRCAVLRLSDKKLLWLPEDVKVIGGRGRRLVIRRKGEACAAKIALPGDK